MESIFIITVSFFTSLITTYSVRKMALKYNIGSLPNERKIHSGFIPSMGGLGIFLGGIAGIIVALLWKEYYLNMFTLKYLGIIIGATVMMAFGILDDIRGMYAGQKLMVQIVASTIVIFFGCRIETIINPFGETLELGFISIPITYLWLIGVTNAVNLLDGLDGLAGGVSLIVLTSFGAIAFSQQDWMTFGICLAIVGGILGFLIFNYHPASIFMGDTGALFLGFLIAALSLKGLQKSEGTVSLLVPFIALTVPIGDTLLAFFRRLSSGKHPFHADKDHLHHRLIALGLSHKQAVHIFYLASILFAIIAYLISTESNVYGLLLFMFVSIIAFFSLKRLGYLEASRQKAYLGDQELIVVKKQMAPISMHRFWHKLLLITSDIVAINISISLIYWLRFSSGIYFDAVITPPAFSPILSAAILFSIFFIGLFALNGLYNIHWDLSRFDIILRMSRVIFFGAIVIFILTFDPDKIMSPTRITIVIFTFSLMILINGLRMILIFVEKQSSILEYSPHKSLLVGTSEKAKKILKDIRNNKHLLYDIIGVVTKEQDEKTISNLKKLGTYQDIPKLIMEHGIEEIIIAINERSRDEILNIVAYGENMRVNFKILPQMYDVVSGHKTEEVIGHPLIRLFPDHMLPWQWILKRMLDFFIAIIGLVILLPLFFVVIIFQFSSGIFPFFIIENKIGKQGKIFGQLLFNYNEKKNFIGRLLYSSNLYKLPQVFNLLIGSISLVGPRPENLETVKELREKIKFYNRRFMIRPGITGWTQVRYRYSESLKHRKEQFKQDLFYLENMSLLLDMRIILRSFFIFFFK